MITKSANGGLFRLSVLTADENGTRYPAVLAPYSSGLYDRAACAWNAVELPRVHIEYAFHVKTVARR